MGAQADKIPPSQLVEAIAVAKVRGCPKPRRRWSFWSAPCGTRLAHICLGTLHQACRVAAALRAAQWRAALPCGRTELTLRAACVPAGARRRGLDRALLPAEAGGRQVRPGMGSPPPMSARGPASPLPTSAPGLALVGNTHPWYAARSYALMGNTGFEQMDFLQCCTPPCRPAASRARVPPRRQSRPSSTDASSAGRGSPWATRALHYGGR